MFNSNASTADAGATYVEDVFSTYLYTGSASAATITNNIDLSTKGGLVWSKGRTGGSGDNHLLIDTLRGVNKPLRSNDSGGQYTETTLTAFNSDGYNIVGNNGDINASGHTYVGWTFREQPKFFDVVTYTGDGASSNPISHNLKSVPGFIIAKKTSGTGDWIVCNRYSDTNWLGGNTTSNWGLNSTSVAGAGVSPTDRGITSSVVDVAKLYGTLSGFDATKANASGATYVMYVFAHDAGGFGLAGTDSVTYCGGVSVSGGAGSVTLGWEPQWVLLKNLDTTGAWYMNDNMRGMTVKDSTNATLYSNTADAETSGTAGAHPTATGFTVQGIADGTYSFLAIRRGPMKVPTDGTTVFKPTTYTGTGAARSITGLGFPPDMVMLDAKTFANDFVYDKLRGPNLRVFTNSTAAEVNDADRLTAFNQDGFSLGTIVPNESGVGYANWNFRRAPSFFDEVCYTGTGSATTQAHNLGAVPELMIVKNRGTSVAWKVYHQALGNTNFLELNSTGASSASTTIWNDTTPTSSVFTVGSGAGVNQSGVTQVAYLFATCAGVSKVGSYTGTATTKQIDCGFAAGARFVLIKRTDSTGDWYCWDSARGIVAGNDPYLLWNSTAAEVTSTDYVDTYAAGFELTSTAPAALNASGGTYIFLAIA